MSQKVILNSKAFILLSDFHIWRRPTVGDTKIFDEISSVAKCI